MKRDQDVDSFGKPLGIKEVFHILLKVRSTYHESHQLLKMVLICFNCMQQAACNQWFSGSILQSDGTVSRWFVYFHFLLICILLFVSAGVYISLRSSTELEGLEELDSERSQLMVKIFCYLLQAVSFFSCPHMVCNSLVYLTYSSIEQTWYIALVSSAALICILFVAVLIVFIEDNIPSNSILSSSNPVNIMMIIFYTSLVLVINSRFISGYSSKLDGVVLAVHLSVPLAAVVMNVFHTVVFVEKYKHVFNICHIICTAYRIWDHTLRFHKLNGSLLMTLILLTVPLLIKAVIASQSLLDLQGFPTRSITGLLRCIQSVQDNSHLSKELREGRLEFLLRKALKSGAIDINELAKDLLFTSSEPLLISKKMKKLIIIAFRAFLRKDSCPTSLNLLYFLHYLMNSETSLCKSIEIMKELQSRKLSFLDRYRLLVVDRHMRQVFSSLTLINQDLQTMKCTTSVRSSPAEKIFEYEELGSLSTIFQVKIYKCFELLSKRIIQQVARVRSIFGIVLSSKTPVDMLHEQSNQLVQGNNQCLAIFNRIEVYAERTRATFHLLPYGLFVYHTQNNARMMRGILKKYLFRNNLFKTFNQKKSQNTQTASHENDIVLLSSVEKGRQGEIEWSGGYGIRYVTKSGEFSAVGHNLFDLISPELREAHLLTLEHYLDKPSSEYIGSCHDRCVKHFDTNVYSLAQVCTIFAPSLQSGVRYATFIELNPLRKYFIIVDSKETVVGISRDLADIDYEDSAFIIGKHLRNVSEDIMGFFHELNQQESNLAPITQSKQSMRSVRFVDVTNICNEVKSTVSCCVGRSIKVDCYFNDIKIVRSRIELIEGQTISARVTSIFFESSRIYRRLDLPQLDRTRHKADSNSLKQQEPEPENQRPGIPRTPIPINIKEYTFSNRNFFGKLPSLQSDTKIEAEEESLEVTFDDVDLNSSKPERRPSYLRRKTINQNSAKTPAKRSNPDDERNEFRQSIVDASSTRKITLVAYDSSSIELEKNAVLAKMKLQIFWVLACVLLVYFGSVFGAYRCPATHEAAGSSEQIRLTCKTGISALK